METLCRGGRAAEDRAWMETLCRGRRAGVPDVSTMSVLPAASNSLPSQSTMFVLPAVRAASQEAALKSLPSAGNGGGHRGCCRQQEAALKSLPSAGNGGGHRGCCRQQEAALKSLPSTGNGGGHRGCCRQQSYPTSDILATPQDGTIVWNYLFRDHTLALSQPGSVSQVVDHCSLHIHHRLTSMGIVVFKIGVAANPGHRFNNPRFGYAHEGYMFMDVLFRGSPRDCALLEDTLIALFKIQRGCRNVNPGGGGINVDNTSYQSHLYVVFAPCGDGIGLVAAKRKRQQS